MSRIPSETFLVERTGAKTHTEGSLLLLCTLLNFCLPPSQLSSTFDISSIPVDEEDANKDLYVKVSDPEQVGEGVSGYVTYLVSVETALPGFEPKFQVRRRFADFQWLHTELVRQHPGYLVPPMP